MVTMSFLCQRSSDGYRNAVKSIILEPLKKLEPKLTQVFRILGPETGQVFKFTDSEVKVTETFSGGRIPING